MPIVNKDERKWVNRRVHLQALIDLGGTALPSKDQRKLTDEELAAGRADDRELSARERRLGKLMQRRPLTPAEHDSAQAELAEILRVGALPPEKRLAAIAESLYASMGEVITTQQEHTKKLERIEASNKRVETGLATVLEKLNPSGTDALSTVAAPAAGLDGSGHAFAASSSPTGLAARLQL